MSDAADPTAITSWHAHIYYSDATRATAAWLRDRLAERFPAARTRALA